MGTNPGTPLHQASGDRRERNGREERRGELISGDEIYAHLPIISSGSLYAAK